tara:strand:- start:856 stop:2850 length:1995 start_codon:yes stop_codon:yes gene_type:complete
MNNFIIECRNKDSLDIIQNFPNQVLQEGQTNGVWSTNLQEKVVLEEGDMVMCRASYIDTKAEASQKIVIEEDTTIAMEFIYYAVNYYGASREFSSPNWVLKADSRVKPLNFAQNVRLPVNDGKIYICCSETSDGTNFEFQRQMTIQGQKALQSVGGNEVFARYTDENGIVRTKAVQIPKYVQVGWGTEEKVDLNILYDASRVPAGQTAPLEIFNSIFDSNGNLVPALDQRLDGTQEVVANLRVLPLTGKQGMSGKLYTPIIGKRSFTLPQGNYDPNELCSAINGLATLVGDTPPTNADLNDNEFLIGVGGELNINADKNHFVEQRDLLNEPLETYGYEFNTASGISPQIVGASQVELSFDPDTNRFKWDFLHTPIFAQASGEAGSEAEKGGIASATGWDADYGGNPNPPLPTIRWRNAKNGGIAFTSLRPASLWADKLGFDLQVFQRDYTGRQTTIPNPNCLLVNYDIRPRTQGATGTHFTVQGVQSSVPVLTNALKDGVNMTTGFMGLSDIFNKASNTFQNMLSVSAPPNTGVPLSQYVTIGQATNEIRAGKGLLDVTSGKSDFGYFLIEVEAQFDNNYLTPSGNRRHIVAIVSKYYLKENYTSSTSADSIMYVHKGPPQLLNSFKCRILDSNKEVPENIGDDNTVILEIVKAQREKQKQIKN